MNSRYSNYERCGRVSLISRGPRRVSDRSRPLSRKIPWSAEPRSRRHGPPTATVTILPQDGVDKADGAVTDSMDPLGLIVRMQGSGQYRLVQPELDQAETHMYKIGVVMGKFYPPHRGHKYLIDTARGQVEQLTVLVCDTPGQTIPAELRASWIQEIHPTVKVMVLDDRDDEADMRIWARNTIAELGHAPDVVFSSEDYGDHYAHLMGAVHVLVDRERRVVPCSGTAVRANPLGNWECLEPCVRAYYAVRVCLVGAESTGKTTLAASLADHYRTTWVEEYGRTYTEEKVRRDPTQPWWSEEFVHIAAEQSRREDLAARECNKILICDTDAFATGIWHERYLGARSDEVEAIAAPRRYALYVLTDPDVPWVDDGTRDGEHLRQWMHGRFREELERLGRPFLLVSGSPEARLATATAWIDQLLDPPIAGHGGLRTSD
jgi:HTH-type transcriptional repressor of NAD biosynthesis genes